MLPRFHYLPYLFPIGRKGLEKIACLYTDRHGSPSVPPYLPWVYLPPCFCMDSLVACTFCWVEVQLVTLLLPATGRFCLPACPPACHLLLWWGLTWVGYHNLITLPPYLGGTGFCVPCLPLLVLYITCHNALPCPLCFGLPYAPFIAAGPQDRRIWVLLPVSQCLGWVGIRWVIALGPVPNCRRWGGCLCLPSLLHNRPATPCLRCLCHLQACFPGALPGEQELTAPSNTPYLPPCPACPVCMVPGLAHAWAPGENCPGDPTFCLPLPACPDLLPDFLRTSQWFLLYRQEQTYLPVPALPVPFSYMSAYILLKFFLLELISSSVCLFFFFPSPFSSLFHPETKAKQATTCVCSPLSISSLSRRTE